MGAIVRNVVNDQLLRLSYKDPKNIKRFLRNWGGLEGLSEKGDTVATCILTDLKTVRGVNSLTTVTEVETADLQKIKINAIQDQIEGDIYSTINKSYIGNYSNSYDNKCLLITAIKGYLRGLEATEGGKGWLKADSSTMEINVAKQKQ